MENSMYDKHRMMKLGTIKCVLSENRGSNGWWRVDEIQ